MCLRSLSVVDVLISASLDRKEIKGKGGGANAKSKKGKLKVCGTPMRQKRSFVAKVHVLVAAPSQYAPHPIAVCVY